MFTTHVISRCGIARRGRADSRWLPDLYASYLPVVTWSDPRPLSTIGVRPAIFASETTRLASTGAGGPAGEPPQWTGFALEWRGGCIEHFPVAPGPDAPWEGVTRTPRTLRWTLRDDDEVIGEGWADVYNGEHGNALHGDFCIVDLGDAALPVRSIEVSADDPDRLPALLETLEVVPLVELIGMLSPPLPEPMPPGPPPDDD
jgi:hypothetical protein